MLLFSLACAPEVPGPDDTGASPLDLRLEDGDYTAGSLELWGPDVVIEPGEDVTHCVAGTLSGGDLGIHAITTWQSAFGHHVQLFRLLGTEIDYPEGESFPCGVGTDFNMTDTQPAGLPTGAFIDGEQTIDQPLDEGMAFYLEGASRYLVQAHYVNTGSEPVRVQDVAVLDLLDPDTEVSTWVAPAVFHNGNLSIPSGSAGSLSFDCDVEAPETGLSVLFVNGHMHQWGTSFRLSRTRGDTTTVLNEVPEWEAVYRDSPPTTTYARGEMDFYPGDVIRTECAWLNDTDETLAFPHEMCDGVSLVYPQKSTTICDSPTGMNP